ncbi:DUF1080 domain-containing protein [soil metagenome]
MIHPHSEPALSVTCKSLVPVSLFLLTCCFVLPLKAEEALGTLVFSDDFARSETQELKDEPGNGWKTSSSWSAKGNKEVDLVDGALYIYIHPEAIHAVDVGHDFAFTDGTATMRFKFHDAKDTLNLNFADLSYKEVHAGHICQTVFGTKSTALVDYKTGGMLLKYYDARKAGTLAKEDAELIKTKQKSVPYDISINEWHTLAVTIIGDTMKASVDGKEIGSFSSPGIAHETKQVLRLLVSNKVTIDDVKYYKLK